MKSKKKYEIVEPIPSSPIGKGIPKDFISFKFKRDIKEKGDTHAQLYEGTLMEDHGKWVIVKIAQVPGWLEGKFLKIAKKDIVITHRVKGWDLRPKPNFWNGLHKKQRIERKRKELEEKGYFDYPDLDKKEKKK